MAHSPLLAAIADNPNLPTPPALALRVLEQASRPDCSLADLARLLGQDPALCGKLLRLVNSALFALPRAVSSLDRALALLGIKRVRTLVLGLSLPALQKSNNNDARTRAYWQASLAGAVISRELSAQLHRPDPENDLVAALLRDVGMLVLPQVYPEEYGRILDHSAVELARSQCELEEQTLGLNHAEVGAYLLQRWRLPPELTEAIQYHHRPELAAAAGPGVAEQAHLLYFATRASQLLLTDGDPLIHQEVVQLAEERYRLGEEQLGDFLEAAGTKVAEFAGLLNVDLGDAPDYRRIRRSATEALVQLATEASLENLRLDEERRQAERDAGRWKRTAQKLHHEMTHDALTGVYNRAFFQEALATEFRRARRRCNVLGLIFLDLDGFKPLNDRFGHPFGDQVLREVGACLLRAVRGGDVVARYGGDEFCVIVTDTSEARLRVVAERLGEAINALTVEFEGNRGKVGASVGGALCFPHRDDETPERLLAAADRAMYASKKKGKNRITIASLLGPEEDESEREIRARLFSVFLKARGLVTDAQLAAAAKLVPSGTYHIGRLARKLEWLTPAELEQILDRQQQSKQLFGTLAVELGLLTPERVWALLALQRERPEDLADVLADRRALAPDQARRLVQEYYGRLTCPSRARESHPSRARSAAE